MAKIATKVVSDIASSIPPALPGRTDEQLTTKTDGDNLEARSVSRTIKTVEDLLRHIEADMVRFEVAASEATKWEVATVDRETGKPTITELHRVFVRLRPRPGPGVKEVVESMIAAASSTIKRSKFKRHKLAKRPGLWSVVVLSDLHMGSRSWRHTTGFDYDLDIASKLVADTSSELIAKSRAMGVTRRTIALAGDTMHFDTAAGTTTSGTYLDRDSRLQKALVTAAESIFAAVEHSAEDTPTDVVIVPGNHDYALSFALQQILVERYRQDKRITVNQQYTSRKYLTHERNLIGVTHGDKAKKKLAGIMALEAAESWSRCGHREWHVGHLHHQAAEISTIDGVIVRTHPTICPSDAWHHESGFIGSEKAVQGYVYRPEGGIETIHMAYATTYNR